MGGNGCPAILRGGFNHQQGCGEEQTLDRRRTGGSDGPVANASQASLFATCILFASFGKHKTRPAAVIMPRYMAPSWGAWPWRIAGSPFGLLVFQKITERIHFLVRDADDVNRAVTNQIEHHMLAFGKTMVALTDI